MKNPHERLGGWLTIELGLEIRQRELLFFILNYSNAEAISGAVELQWCWTNGR